MQSFLTISSFVLNEHVKGDENLLKSRLGVRRVAGSMQDFMDNCSTYNWDIQNLLKVDSDGAWRHSSENSEGKIYKLFEVDAAD